MSNVMLRTWVAVETWIASLRDEERGQGLVEYALIIALVSVLLVLALTSLKNGISNTFSNAVSAM